MIVNCACKLQEPTKPQRTHLIYTILDLSYPALETSANTDFRFLLILSYFFIQ